MSSENKLNTLAPQFLQGGGEMGELIRSVQWSATPLGQPESWPVSLKVSTGILLSSKFPMLLCWGKDFIQLYNDEFRPILGDSKHPQAMGISASETYAEIWETIKPMFECVMNGETVGFSDFMVPLHRNGYMEDCYFDFSYSPIKDETGNVDGVLVICKETTQAIISKRKIEASDRNLRLTIRQAPVAMAIFRGSDYMVDIANSRALALWGRTEEEVLHKPIMEVLPELESQGIKSLLDHVYQTGEAFSANELPVQLQKDGQLETSYLNFVYEPLYNHEAKIDGIVTIGFEVTAEVIARKKAEESEEKLEQVLNQLPARVAVFLGPEFAVATINKEVLAVWNKEKEQIIGKPLLEILPELEGQPFPAQLKHVFETGETISNKESLVMLKNPDGSSSNTYVDYSYQPLTDALGNRFGILGMAFDVTDKVKAKKQLESFAEELQGMNEEMVSANEELTVTNEELAEAQHDLQQTVTELAASEARFRFLLNAIPQQVWTAIPDGSLDYVNQVVCNDFGYNTVEIVGHGWQKFIHPDDLPVCLEKWIASLSTGKEYLVEFRLLFKDGTYYWHLARAIPLIENEKITLWLGTNTNIELQKNNELKKDEFLSIASHELRTPLTTIKAFNQLMGRSQDPEKLNAFIKKSAEHITRLEKLINDLLDVTKINSGKVNYNMQSFSFRQMLENSIDTVRATSGSHSILFEGEGDIDYNGDQFRLEQVMNNFLTNAIKYSPKAEKVIVNFKLDQNKITVSVRDFGIGIAPESLDRLFERYYRVDNTSMRFEGLGLGLFISSEVLKRHHGTFWIESELNKGSTFYFSLPIND